MKQIEDIDTHIEEYEAKEVKASASLNAEQLRLFNVCNTYQKIKPIIKFIRGFLFFKPKWQKVLDEFIAVSDAACPIV